MLLVVVRKELHRVFSDKRLVFSAFILPALSIFLIYSFMGSMFGDRIENTLSHRPSVYVYQAPTSFQSFINASVNGYDVHWLMSDIPMDEAKEDIKEGDADLIIEFEDDFDSKVVEYASSDRIAQIRTFYNPSEEYSVIARNQVTEELLKRYEETILEQRYGNVDYAKGFVIDRDNEGQAITDPAKATGTGLSMILPMLVAILLFAGAMGIGLDIIAGEKERGTMATMLMTPVPRRVLALGKVIGLAIVAMIGASISFLAILASLPNAGKMMTGGDVRITNLSFTPWMLIELLVVMLTLVSIYVGLICLVSVHARSVKEAGTYISPIYMLVMFAAFSTVFQSGEVELSFFAIPVLGNVLSIKQLLTFDLTLSQFLVNTGVSIVFASILIHRITIAFDDEKVMLG